MRRLPTSQSTGADPAVFSTRSSGVPPTSVWNCASLTGSDVSGV
jgi:hypothetical protein